MKVLKNSFACIIHSGIPPPSNLGAPDNNKCNNGSSLDLQAYHVSDTGLDLNSLNLQNSAVGQGSGAHFTDVKTEAPGVIFTSFHTWNPGPSASKASLLTLMLSDWGAS